MGTGSRQRRFIDEAVEVLRQIGCSIEKEQSKHFKITITFGQEAGVWKVSSTPKTTNSQSKAIGDLRRLLRRMGVPEVPNADAFSVNLTTLYDRLWTIINDCLRDAPGEIDVSFDPQLAKFKSLHPSLSREDLKALADLFENLLIQDDIYSSYDQFAKTGAASAKNWAVVVPGAARSSKASCCRNVIAFAAQKGGYQRIELRNV